jgi:hypothetical protein
VHQSRELVYDRWKDIEWKERVCVCVRIER